MDKKTILAMLLRDGLKSLAGALVLHGWLGSGSTEAFIGVGMLIGSSLWSFWVTSGRAMAQASLAILQDRVLAAAARAKANPAAAAPALASVAAHVEATAPPAPNPLAPAIVALIAGTALLGLLQPGAAYAQAQRQPAVRAAPAETAAAPAAPRTTTHGFPCDLLNLLPGCQIQSQDANGRPMNEPVELNLWKKITTAALPDLDYASALAAAANTGASAVRKQCWDAMIVANKQASGSGAKDATGAVMTKPDPHLFTDVESLAEVLDNLAPGGPLWTSCAGAAQLAKTNVLTLLNAMVTGATGMAALGVT